MHVAGQLRCRHSSGQGRAVSAPSVPACLTCAMLRHAGTLQGTVGMSGEQVLLFALAGGLDGGSFTRTDVGAERATDRLKQLLLVRQPALGALLEGHGERHRCSRTCSLLR